MATNIYVIQDNYKSHDNIGNELEIVDLENFLDFDNNGNMSLLIVGLAVDHFWDT